MVNMRKALTLVLAMVLIFSLAACGQGKNNEGSNSANSGDDGKIDTSKFEKITYVVLGDKPKNGQLEKVMKKVNAIMKEKINAELEFKWVEWADYSTKYNLLLASGEPVDLITVATDWLDTWGNAQRGAFEPLDKLLPKYAPQTWQEVPKDHWDESSYKGKIIMIPEDHYTQWVDHGVFYRNDWAKEAGITEPIKDFETLGKYFQYIKDNKKKVVPWDVNGSSNELYMGYAQSMTDQIELPIGTGYINIFDGKSYDDKYTVDSPVFDDKFIDFAKMTNEWAKKGFWREDVLNFKGDTRTELKSGLTGADSHHTQTYGGLRVELDKQQPGSELQMFSYGDTRNNLVQMSITHGGTAVGAHSKDPGRALMAYELIRQNEEVYHLINYGIEGVQYELKDGKRVKPAGYDDTRDAFYTDFWGGRVDKFEIPSESTWEGLPKMMEDKNNKSKPYPYGKFVFDKSKVEAEMTAISQVTGEMAPAILYGKAGDPEKAVKSFRDKLKKAGYDKVKDEIQRQLDEFKKANGGK